MMKFSTRKLRLPAGVFFFVLFLLIPIQLVMEKPLLLAERFAPGAGWAELILIAAYGALVAWKMQDPAKVAAWRRYTWMAFSLVFFSQLVLGLIGHEIFLMTGELHLPVPVMIVAGPLYRGHISIMTILFLSTLLLSGPAWCSHLCYFGAIDSSLAAKRKPAKEPLRNLWAMKSIILLLVIASALLLRIFGIGPATATWLALGFGIIGLGIILLISRKQGRMVHCTAYCPIGTLVSLGRFISPFRMYIEKDSCTDCMSCAAYCKYDALKPADISARKPGLGCTLCGDCLQGCPSTSIKYRFPGLSPEKARGLYLLITISLHAAFMALARM